MGQCEEGDEGDEGILETEGSFMIAWLEEVEEGALWYWIRRHVTLKSTQRSEDEDEIQRYNAPASWPTSLHVIVPVVVLR